MKRRVAVVVVVVCGLGVVAGCCAPQLIDSAMTPGGEFDPALVPAEPDYANDAAWLALPTTKDEADVALAELPAVDVAAVDVFYLHPTSSVEARWNAPFDDDAVRAASIRGGTLIQASVFNGCCAVYAPTYRQASGAAFTHPSTSGDRALDLAFSDVRAAFAEFRKRAGARPFVLAGHSQGAALAGRLLREVIAVDVDERARLVAAYLPGAPFKASDLGGLRACASREEVGCVVTFNARKPDHRRNVFDFGADVDESQRLCVNPTLGSTSSAPAPASAHGGALFFDADDAPTVIPAFASSVCKGGRLVVTELKPLPPRDPMSGVLLWVMSGENLHPIEVQLFYVDLRADVGRRVAAFLSSR
ncbi:MAG: DUF3089 domain-containing protein [Deltaproteobacteria bacterium]|nr:DUF3089 domain-containing protein [Deltaproteobacteria bacterium]